MGDFGFAAQLNHSCSVRSIRCGTSWYMAPEVYEGKTELKSDVWSLGISLIELAEGENPIGGNSMMQVVRNVYCNDPPSLDAEKWSAAFVDFVNKCLVKDVKERWSVSELMDVSSFTGE